jgi:hypothetical protein
VRLGLPRPVRAGFEETLDLHRALAGSSRATVGSFLEALRAETLAAGIPADVERQPGRRRASQAEREARLARETGRWKHLGPAVCFDPQVQRLCPELQELADLDDRAGRGSCGEVLSQIGALGGLEDSLWVRLGSVLAGMAEGRALPELRFTDVGHYASERLRMSATSAERRVGLERSLARLPRLRRAYEQGWVGFECARLVVQAVGREPLPAEVERAWVTDASGSTVKRLRDVAGLGRCFPAAEGEAGASSPPRPPDDATWRSWLVREPGRTRQRVRALGLQALDWPFEDETLRLRLTWDEAEEFLGAVEAYRARLEAMVVASGNAEAIEAAANLPASLRAAAMFKNRSQFPYFPVDVRAGSDGSPAGKYGNCDRFSGRRLPSWVGLLAMLEEYAETWDDPEGMPERPNDPIHHRDGWRCFAPGCTSRRNLQVHHVIYRSRGGDDDPATLILLCEFHHLRGEHGGLLRVEGEAPLDLVFRLGSPELGRWYRNERRIGPA